MHLCLWGMDASTRQEDQLIHRRYTGATAKLFVSFLFEARSKSGNIGLHVAEETVWSSMVAIGNDGGCMYSCTGIESGSDSLKNSVFSGEWNVAEESASRGGLT